MKRLFAALLVFILLGLVGAGAQDAEPTVFVSISDDAGALVLAYAPVALADRDGDGVLSVCDALAEAHAVYCPLGAEGFVAEKTEWGASLYRLWGVENGGSYGYMLNDASAWSLLDPVRPGDHIKAYAFADLMNFSDTYAFFAAPAADAAVHAELPLTLQAAGYDEAWNPVTMPVAGAVLTVNGEKTDAVTNEDGLALLRLTQPGVYTVSAVKEEMPLVPPVCIVTVTE